MATRRDFIYVKDGSKTYALNGERLRVHNIGYGKAVIVNQLVTMIKHYLNSVSEIHYLPNGPVKSKFLCGNR